jgi:hypothetical protein
MPMQAGPVFQREGLLINALGKNFFENSSRKKKKKFCSNQPTLIFALPKRYHGIKREKKKGV